MNNDNKLQAIAIMALVDGILNVLWSIALLPTLVFWIYPMVLGILEIVYASRSLSGKPVTPEETTRIGIMQIVNIVSGNIVSLTMGIVTLVLINQETA